ncbi:hypothetical protein D8Y22_10680 [Salinadaptatus halalkaliphilus]|uniref:DUF6760 domain-containing protein n=1 Tax=Salinadaptatus halalkaliphilus TaxID=2419781 RepID=A0A4S3TKZ6_9EURY|nr:DUF6760 family protein [Salinadaptatus halalkaliphilus]THE64829.1 hypothetical protein D8Y22_10680 [Salinadaptatus halalkaliphilus]
MIQLYDRETLYEEVAFVAYHFGWSHDEVLALPHWERHRWCDEISEINERMNEAPSRTQQRQNQHGQSGSILEDEGDGIVLQNALEDL